MWHWEATPAIRWPPFCFLSTEVVVHIFFGVFIFIFFFWFWFGPPIPTPTPVLQIPPNLPAPPPLPLLYAVMKADVGLFCCVLLSLSPLPPDYIPTSRTTGRRRRWRRWKESYAVHEKKRKASKWIMFKKEIKCFLQFVSSFISLPNTKWCFIFRLGKLSYAKHIRRRPGGTWRSLLELKLFCKWQCGIFCYHQPFSIPLLRAVCCNLNLNFIFYYGSYYLLWLIRSVQNGDVEWMLMFGFRLFLLLFLGYKIIFIFL